MELKIVVNENLIKSPSKWILKNFELVEEGEKMFLRYPIDRQKELRIFFKNTLLEPEKKEHIKKVFSSGEGIEELLTSLWIVKSSSSGVLLFVPYETEASEKNGVFVLAVGKSFFYPSPLYFKRSHITGVAASLFYVIPKNIIFLLGEDVVTLIYNTANTITSKKYTSVETLES